MAVGKGGSLNLGNIWVTWDYQLAAASHDAAEVNDADNGKSCRFPIGSTILFLQVQSGKATLAMALMVIRFIPT
jgi:hypothetical protein